MASEKKVALITGGASGMGYAVAEALSSQGDWDIHLLDMTTERGNAAAERLNATFHTVDVNNYESLGGVFKTVFKKTKRLDFVHANAGIVEKGNFYAVHDTGDEPPPPLPSVVIDIDLMSVIHTSYLAQHYFRQSPKDDIGPRSLIVTASCGGLYAIPQSPAYTAAKFGCVGFVRSIAGRMWREDGIRVNAICPGTVRTNLLPEEGWKTFPKEYFIPIENVVKVVLMLLDNNEKDSAGKPIVGQTVEISSQGHYFRTQHDFCDEAMTAIMRSTEN